MVWDVRSLWKPFSMTPSILSFWVGASGCFGQVSKHLSCKMAPSFSSEWLAHCHGDTKGPWERHPKENHESWHITLEYWIVLGLSNLLEDHWNLKCWVCFLIHNVDTILALSWCRMLAVYFSNSSATAGIPVSLSWNICSTHVEPPEVTYTWKEGATWLQHARGLNIMVTLACSTCTCSGKHELMTPKVL